MENDKTYLRDINGCSIEQPVIYSGTEDPNTLLETTLKKSKDGDVYIKYTSFHDHLEKRNLFFFCVKIQIYLKII